MKIKVEQIFEKGLKIKENKTNTLTEILVRFINQAKENDILPNKKEISSHLNLSIGTVQNAYRILEDRGLVQSKQRVGTIITSKKFKKQTSKRDCCINAIMEYMEEKNIDTPSKLPSIRELSKELHMTINTVSSAIKSLESHKESHETKTLTLVEKIEKELISYIKENCKVGDNIPSINALAASMNVSIKTVHDAIKNLSKKKILLPHRGKYGTVVIKHPDEKQMIKKEDSIFAPAKEAAFYFYEKVQNHIKELIIKNYEIGSKLPSINELAVELNVNPNTIRHALKYLEEDGYVAFTRGRYGGTFVTNIPDENSFKWLAVNPQYIAFYN